MNEDKRLLQEAVGWVRLLSAHLDSHEAQDRCAAWLEQAEAALAQAERGAPTLKIHFMDDRVELSARAVGRLVRRAVMNLIAEMTHAGKRAGIYHRNGMIAIVDGEKWRITTICGDREEQLPGGEGLTTLEAAVALLSYGESLLEGDE